MTLKENIENLTLLLNGDIKIIKYDETGWNEGEITEKLKNILSDLEKAQQEQDELVKALTKQIMVNCSACNFETCDFEKDCSKWQIQNMKLVEKYYGKKWEEIIK